MTLVDLECGTCGLRWSGSPGAPCPVGHPEPTDDAALHESESHPGYEYATTSGPRKAWDPDESRPIAEPGEPSWERNLHRGLHGWDRFDAREEAYWMRRMAPVGDRAAELVAAGGWGCPRCPSGAVHTDGDTSGANRIAELELVIREWIAANDAPAKSSDRGETSVWLARTSDAERALRRVVGAEAKFPISATPGVVERAERLERDLQESIVRIAALETALRFLIARVRRTGGYASPEDQAALWEAERVLGGGA